MDSTAWTPAPDGQVLPPGHCRARDADGQACAGGLVHLGQHQSTGLRAWLEAGGQALIRAYDAADADRSEAIEAPLFKEFNLVPIARQDLVRSVSGGVSFGWSMLVGPLLAPAEKAELHLRVVCFARL